MSALGFKEQLMLVLVSELDNFVFNRGAIARPATLDLPALHRSSMQIVLNQLMDFRVGPRNPTRDLVHLKVVAQE